MLYTIGLKKTYDARLKDNESDLLKVGKKSKESYSGGCVFHSKELARDHCPNKYDVYGLEASEDDVEESPETPWDHLLYDRPIVQLPERT